MIIKGWTWSATISGHQGGHENILYIITPPAAWTVNTRQDGCLLSYLLHPVLTPPFKHCSRNRDSSRSAALVFLISPSFTAFRVILALLKFLYHKWAWFIYIILKSNMEKKWSHAQQVDAQWWFHKNPGMWYKNISKYHIKIKIQNKMKSEALEKSVSFSLQRSFHYSGAHL